MYLGSPFLRDGLGQTSHTSLRQRIICLSSIAVCTTRTRNINNTSRLTILYPEVLRRFPDQLERRSIVHSKNRIPLLICDLMNDTIPSVPSVVDDDVDLAIAELRCFLDEHGEVCWICDIARDGDGTVRRGRIDLFGHAVGFGRVDVADHDFGALVGEEARAFGADALA
jgi:hypothetical protein